jgi:hypothetical protein
VIAGGPRENTMGKILYLLTKSRRRHLKVTVVSGDTLVSDLRDTCPDEEIDLEHHSGVRSR